MSLVYTHHQKRQAMKIQPHTLYSVKSVRLILKVKKKAVEAYFKIQYNCKKELAKSMKEKTSICSDAWELPPYKAGLL
jgi:hypothetical protein